jgi:hypothetical protein
VFYCPTAYVYTHTNASFADDYWLLPSGSSAPNTTLIGYYVFAGNDNARAWNNARRHNVPPPYKNKEKRLGDLPLFIDIAINYLPPAVAVSTWGFSSHMESGKPMPAGRNTCYGDGRVEWLGELKIKFVDNATSKIWW